MRCIENFDLTSEELLGIDPFPEETCPHNYPVYEYLDLLQQYLLSLREDDNELTQHPEYEDYRHHGDELIQITASFHAWFEGWSGYYNDNLRDLFLPAQQAHVDHCIVDIQQAFLASDINVAYFECAMDEIAAMYDVINAAYIQYTDALEEHANKTTELIDDLSDIDYEIQRSNDDEFVELLAHRAAIRKLLESHKQEIPSYADCLGSTRDHLEQYLEFFGGAMQRRFAAIRHKVIHLKQLIKQYAREDQLPNCLPLKQKPVPFLQAAYTDRLNPETTLYCASPETLVRRCQIMEQEMARLCPDDRQKLQQGCVNTAIKRVLIDYPEYERIVWFTSLENARHYTEHTITTCRAPDTEKAA